MDISPELRRADPFAARKRVVEGLILVSCGRQEAGKTDLAAPVSAKTVKFRLIVPIPQAISTRGVEVSTTTDEIVALSSSSEEGCDWSLSPGVEFRWKDREGRDAEFIRKADL